MNRLFPWLIALAVIGCEQLRDRQLAMRDSLLHEPGIQDPESSEFHGALLRSTGYDFALCAKCHGERFQGGASQVSCVKCHEQGPTECSTCHREPDLEHRAHAAFDCGRCHEVPERWDAIGHLDPPPAEVHFDEGGAFDANEKRCSDIACHGVATPTWRAGEGQADCGTCHGIPPPSHASARCESCHPISTHLDGVVQLGRSEEGCRGCHGEPDAPAPGDRGHRVHLMPELHLSGPIACSDCHEVPEEIDSAGHLDSELPAEVFPAEIASISLAFARGARPTFSEGSCSSTYCHGDATISWSDGTIICGSCHGVPPPSHEPSIELSDCATCHANAEHLDGNVDF
jgi:predicted CxxxxCH...CXXCH cytochrome family protein